MLVSLLLFQLCISSYAQIERTREFVNFDKGGAFVHCFFSGRERRYMDGDFQRIEYV